MAHHKRGKKKSSRAGCLMCKPHKGNAFKDTAGARTRQEIWADDRQESFEDDQFLGDDDESV